MSFGLSRGKAQSYEGFGLTQDDLGPLPDSVLSDPEIARIDPRSWFENPERRFELEIGSGKGTFLVQTAPLTPETNFLGIEWAGEFFAYAADRVRRNRLANVRMLHTDATEFLHWRVPSGIVEVIHLYFSDPWPKARHHKRRVVQDRFLEDCLRTLLPGGELRIVTDHDAYWSWMEEHFARWAPPDGSGRFHRLEFERPDSASDGEVVGTNFERKYRREGRPFNATVLRKPER